MTPALLIAALLFTAPADAAVGPRERVDPLTGHRIVRISGEAGSASLYFHQNSYTPDGRTMVISVPGGIAKVDVKSWTVSPLVTGERLQLLFTGRRTRSAYYSVPAADGIGSTIWAADIDSGKTRRIAALKSGTIGSINADETLLLGQWAERDPPLQPTGAERRDRDQNRMRFGQTDYAANGPDGKPLTYAEAKEVRLNERLEARIPMEIFTIDIRTGARRVVTASTDWLNHIQFSPTDPTLIMYCHEGPWHKVDRIWTIRTDGSEKTKIHIRTMNMEIAGHEFFAPDGKTIWYDLQTPRGEKFWLAGYELGTGKRKWYHLERNQWSVHFNQSPDRTLFSGDGGDSEMVAHAPDGKYLYLFHPQDIPDVAGIHAPGAENLISPGRLQPERLVDMRKHDYRLEPNMTFTPDGRWVVFRSNMEGENHIYAVELAKAAGK
ncbi:oligogalacturonate lyase family protein [Sphingosinicella sp. BN140058]|uniref:oligogalacturonate lyase family protein n=1 Tax=Sphingosinicella sp. BN140058 TaxID=1892855 RepID=UPI001012AFBB|nr:oligogalacturonate lyase family protein [Sphingosinicella sp. BN140058]QAY76299.1 oligogalacturonate lyase [Sphingosinicella sp. BN140058]